MKNVTKKAYTKSRLIKELAFRADISQQQSRAALEAIIEIAYREARENYFILPGLCKFDVVHRNERSVRNPATGETLILPPREALHVTLSKRAKETVVPRVAPMRPEEYEIWKTEHPAPEPVVEAAEPQTTEPPTDAEETAVAAEQPPVISEPIPSAEVTAPISDMPETAAVEQPPVPEAEQPPVPEADYRTDEEPASEPVSEPEAPTAAESNGTEDTGDISFRCTTCGQEVIAPAGTIGREAECPACGAIIIVPDHSEPGTTCAPGGDAEKEIITQEEVEKLVPSTLKHRTIRIDSSQFDDIISRLSAQSAGSNSKSSLKSCTMRIDLPDEF